MTKEKRLLSFKAAVQLAAPHTWPASILPVLLGSALGCAGSGVLDAAGFFLTLCVAVLLQSAVNSLNDYADFVSGLDTQENCPDATDAALVYECSSPKAALYLGLLFLFGAAVFGAALVAHCSAAMLIYGAVALAAILIYTVPFLGFSKLPLGELLSGGTMGGVLTIAAFHVQTGLFREDMLYLCLPMLIMIGCIMLVNNTADIEKDSEGGRRTLPVCVGRKNAQLILRAAILLSLVMVGIFVCFFYTGGVLVLPVLALSILIDPFICRLFSGSIDQAHRPESMRGVLEAHVRINLLYAFAVFIHILSK